MGKGNGKTPLAAVIGHYGLVGDGEIQPEVYAAAVTRDQANILFTDARHIALGSPELARRLDVLEHNLGFRDGFFRTVSAEARSLDGKRPHFSLIDEIHEHPDGQVVQKMRAGMKRRMQPLVFEITNAGYDRASICWEHHEHSRQVLEGTVAGRDVVRLRVRARRGRRLARRGGVAEGEPRPRHDPAPHLPP